MNLVVMAAGMGSRFGGLKQLTPVGPNGEFLIDYSIYDAIKAGFDKVVFIIKEENYDIFRDTIGKRVEEHIKVEYAFQKLENIPEGYDYKDRKKPWGTSHAILSCKDKVKGDFLVINADDFYGKDSFKQASDFFRENKEGEYAIIDYKVANTLTENGAVKRGICEEKNNYLTNIIESSIEKNNGKIIASPLDGRAPFEIKDDTPVSMNMFCLKDNFFEYLEKNLIKFFEKNKNDLSNCEYLLPESVFGMIQEGKVKVRMIPTTSKWYGMTYKEDLEGLKENIQKMIDEGIYPSKLWG